MGGAGSNNASGGSCDGEGGGAASSRTSGGGVVGTDELRAVMELGKRDAVKRLLKQARTIIRGRQCHQQVLKPVPQWKTLQ